MKAVLLDGAQSDIRDLRGYIVKLFGKTTWLTTYGAIKATIQTAVSFPYEGNTPPELVELGLDQYRQVLSGMNRIIYEVRNDVLYIHVICDTRRDLRTLLARRQLRR